MFKGPALRENKPSQPWEDHLPKCTIRFLSFASEPCLQNHSVFWWRLKPRTILSFQLKPKTGVRWAPGLPTKQWHLASTFYTMCLQNGGNLPYNCTYDLMCRSWKVLKGLWESLKMRSYFLPFKLDSTSFQTLNKWLTTWPVPHSELNFSRGSHSKQFNTDVKFTQTVSKLFLSF